MASKALPSPEVLRQLLRYEPETGKLFWLPRPLALFSSQRAANSWNASNAGNPALNSLAQCGYFRGTLLWVNAYAHRVIWKMHFDSEPDLIDHIDRDARNNRLENLRPATKRTNALNTAGAETKGIWQHSASDRYYATLGREYLGLFKTKEEAISARSAALARVLG